MRIFSSKDKIRIQRNCIVTIYCLHSVHFLCRCMRCLCNFFCAVTGTFWRLLRMYRLVSKLTIVANFIGVIFVALFFCLILGIRLSFTADIEGVIVIKLVAESFVY